MSDFKPGEMDIRQQKDMYSAFWGWSTRIVILLVVVLTLMYAFLT